ncbi:hypothetical protein CEY16_11775 [Halalkalibacillus sediminis]|uniref:ATP-dependent acyl-CoA ligase n=1 Tax=Halalkalibacillus sediminis TaxID=2018042 RepID=A0A2I0QST0_9BACI|nr:AMP-binding protein [Halalkalibacillus sediminis]PKR77402.1 hypothetical protein CEY16_11775 [Halalkalibacillus sediminis]
MLTHGDLTIYSYLIKQAEKFNDKTFIYFEDEKISYLDMLNRSNQIASWLADHGIQKGDTVSVLIPNNPLFYEIWFGCAAIGAIFIPINTGTTSVELEYFLQHSESKGIIYDPSLTNEYHMNVMRNHPLNFHREFSNEWKSEVSKYSDSNHFNDIDSDDVSSIVYTSGTTAKPKGVMITHENYLFAGHSSVTYQQLTSEDRYLIFLPLFHVNSQYYTSMSMLVAGGSIILLEKFSANTFWDTVAKYDPTVSSFVATIIKVLLRMPKHPKENNHNIRHIGYGLFVNKSEIDEFVNRFNIHLFQWYGMTESITTNIVTPLYEDMPVDEKSNILALGKPALGHEVKIVNDEGEKCANKMVGEIIIKSPSLMKGYLKNEEETNKSLRNGWLYTGDFGYRNEEGYIWFVDRDKDVIKRAGENISSLEIENVLNDHPHVQNCAIIGVPDEIREEKVVAYIETDSDSLTDKDIINYCENKISSFKIPEDIYFVKDFPRTSIGKIQKHLLRNQYDSESRS